MLACSERMIAKKDGAIGWMIFNNPDRMNAVSIDMWDAIPLILAEFEEDPDIRVIVLKGAGGKSFVAGADISQFDQVRATKDGARAYERMAAAAFDRIAQSNRPTIAMIDGYCIGAGLGIALACDLRYAAEGSTFAIPAARLGLGYGAESTRRAVDIVGAANAKEILFTARRFTHDEALAMGLINRFYPYGTLEKQTRATCAMIAENAPLTLMAAKEIIDETHKPSPHFDEQYCSGLVERCFSSEDYVEGRAAFMEKRKPQFKGR